MTRHLSQQRTCTVFTALFAILFVLDPSTDAFSPTARSTTLNKPTTSMPLSASSNENNNVDHRPSTRRSLFSQIATAATTTTTMVLLPSSAARAEFGQSTTMAPPGLVPSPIRPSGEMAKTCEIFALGREDVCLVPLKLPSTYDKVLIGRALDKLEGSSGGGDDDGGRVVVASLLRSLEVADWDAFDEVLAKVSSSSGNELSKGSVKKLQKLGVKKDAPEAIKAVLKITDKL